MKSESERILYFDCGSGISGDMLVSSMVDLGVDPEKVKAGLESLGIFRVAAAGWAKAHRTTTEEVTFHERGASRFPQKSGSD